jgi:hypothetical protein
MQEYIAAMAELEVGEYWQVSTNLHVYYEQYKRMNLQEGSVLIDSLDYGPTLPLVQYPNVFDDELLEVMNFIDDMWAGNLPIYDGNISNTFLREVVLRMAMAHYLYKSGNMTDALDIVDTVTAPDWKQAGREWLERRRQ